jgi:hypothetical protein
MQPTITWLQFLLLLVLQDISWLLWQGLSPFAAKYRCLFSVLGRDREEAPVLAASLSH